MNGRAVSVKVYLDPESRAILEEEAGSYGLSLSAFFRALAKMLKVPAQANTPILEIRGKFREIMDEERRHDRK